MSTSSSVTFSPIAVLNTHGDIVEVNQAWKAFGERNGLSERYTAVGKNYVTVTRQSNDKYGDRVVTELRRLLAGEQTEFMVAYPCHSLNQERWFRLYATAISFDGSRYYLLVHQRLNQDPPLRGNSLFDIVDTPTRRANYRDRNRLVTYSLSSDESASEGLFIAFDAIGIDLQGQDTTLQDWIDPGVVNDLQTSISDFHITLHVWNYPVGLTPEKVIIYTPERNSK